MKEYYFILFLIIKKKFKKVVYKRRVVMSHDQSIDYLFGGKKPFDDQIIREIDYFFDFYKPSPAVFLAYDRIAMLGIEDNELRMTFDSNIRSRFDDLDLTLGDHGTLLLNGDEKYLLEIKMYQAMPLWLSAILSELEIVPTSFSKYGKVYEAKLADEIMKNKKEIYTYV